MKFIVGFVLGVAIGIALAFVYFHFKNTDQIIHLYDVGIVQPGPTSKINDMGQMCVKVNAFQTFGGHRWPACEVWAQVFEGTLFGPFSPPNKTKAHQMVCNCTDTDPNFVIKYLSKWDDGMSKEVAMKDGNPYTLVVWIYFPDSGTTPQTQFMQFNAKDMHDNLTDCGW
jgi:hypothetical protein